MNKSFSAKVLILVLVVVLGGAVVFFQKWDQKNSLKSDALATVVTPATCNLQSDIDTKIGEKNSLVNVQKKSVQEIQNALATIDPLVLADQKLATQKKELDILWSKKMSTEKPSDTAYLQAKKKVDGMKKPVIPTEPSVPAEPIVPEKPVLAAAPVVPTKPTVPTEPLVPVKPTVPTEPVVPSKPVLVAAPVVPTKPTVPVAPVAPNIPTVWTSAYTNYINVLKPAYDKAKNTYDTVTKPAYDKALTAYNTALALKNTYDTITKPAYDKALAEYNLAVAAKKTYDTVTKPAYDKAQKAYDTAVAAKKVYDTTAKPAYDKALAEYNLAVAAKKTYDTVTKPAYDKALAEYNTALVAKRTYDTVTKPAFDKANNTYDIAVAAKKVYDTTTKPAYDKAKKVYDDALIAKNVYDTVTKPAYTKALWEYNAAVSAKKTYDTVTKPAFDKAKNAYDTAVAAKKVYDDALSNYTNLFDQYKTQLEQYSAYTTYKSALDTYVISITSALGKNIDTMKGNICPATENLCANKIDDDRDGIQDCDDSDCSEDNACKKDVVTCTESDGAFRLEHSNGSTDFSWQVFTIGWMDPYTVKYDVEYTKTNITFRADTYLNGEKIQCPEIIAQNDAGSEGDIETCEETLEYLRSESDPAADSMKCTGPYSFTLTYELERPEKEKSGLLSSFLKSDFFDSRVDNENSTTDTCDTENCFECATNQTRDDAGNCVDVWCSFGQEEVNGQCVDSCTPPQVRNSYTGVCEDPGCPSGEEIYNGSCVPVCPIGQTRGSDGSCACSSDEEMVNNVCTSKCTSPETRQSDGTCSSGGYCGNGVVDAGEECDDTWSECVWCKKTTTPYCGDGTVDVGEECDDGNTSDNDGCSSTCKSGYCGDSWVDSGEECDDGNTSDNDGCNSTCKKECTNNPWLGSSFFWLNLNWLKSSATGGNNCPKKWCTIKAAENYDGDVPEYEDDHSCTCKNDLDPYTYNNCRCQPTHDWCYIAKWGECKKAGIIRRIIIKIVRNVPAFCAHCIAPGSWQLVPEMPIGADGKPYKFYNRTKDQHIQIILENDCSMLKK